MACTAAGSERSSYARGATRHAHTQAFLTRSPHPLQIGTCVYFATTNVMYAHDGKRWHKRDFDRISEGGGGRGEGAGGRGEGPRLLGRRALASSSHARTPSAHPRPRRGQYRHPATALSAATRAPKNPNAAKRMFGPALRDLERWQQRRSSSS